MKVTITLAMLAATLVGMVASPAQALPFGSGRIWMDDATGEVTVWDFHAQYFEVLSYNRLLIPANAGRVDTVLPQADAERASWSLPGSGSNINASLGQLFPAYTSTSDLQLRYRDGDQWFISCMPLSSTYPEYTGGPYTIGPGQSIMLNGEPELPDWVELERTFTWDLNDDRHPDVSGRNATITYDYLVNDLGLAPGTHSINLVETWTNHPQDWGYEFTTLTIVPEPATMSLLALGGAAMLRRRRQIAK